MDIIHYYLNATSMSRQTAVDEKPHIIIHCHGYHSAIQRQTLNLQSKQLLLLAFDKVTTTGCLLHTSHTDKSITFKALEYFYINQV